MLGPSDRRRRIYVVRGKGSDRGKPFASWRRGGYMIAAGRYLPA